MLSTGSLDVKDKWCTALNAKRLHQISISYAPGGSLYIYIYIYTYYIYYIYIYDVICVMCSVGIGPVCMYI